MSTPNAGPAAQKSPEALKGEHPEKALSKQIDIPVQAPTQGNERTIQEIQAAARQLMESISPNYFAAREKVLKESKEPEKIEAVVTQMFFSAEEVVQLMRACKGVTWKVKDDGANSLHNRWTIRGNSTPDSTKTIPLICIVAPGGGEEKMLSFTVV